MATSFLEDVCVVQKSLFAFSDGRLPASFCLPLHFRHHSVGESERGRPFPLPFLFGSCLNAHASSNKPWPFVIQRDAVSSVGFGFFASSLLFLIPFIGAPIAILSASRFLALK